MPDFLEIFHREWPVIKQAPYSFLICVVVVCAIVWVIFDRRYRHLLERGEAGGSSSASKVEGSGNSTANATGGSITQHFHGPLAQASAPTVDAAREPFPCIERLDIRSAKVLHTNGRADKWFEHENGFLAHIIEFRNRHAEMGKEGAKARNVVARLIFTPMNSKRIINNAACWLDEPTQCATLEPGETRRLMIVVDLRMGGLYTLYNPREYLPSFYSSRAAMRYPVKPIDPMPLSSIPCNVELALISENLTLYNEHYELQWSDGIIRLLPKPTGPQS